MVIYTLMDDAAGQPFYVGQTADPDQRVRRHFSNYGTERPGMFLMVLEAVTWDRAFEAECRWAHALQVPGGCGCFGTALHGPHPAPREDGELCLWWANEVVQGWDLERMRRRWERLRANVCKRSGSLGRW